MFEFAESWKCPDSVRGFVFDNDGCLIASSLHNREHVVRAIMKYASTESLGDTDVARIDQFVDEPEVELSQQTLTFLQERFPNGFVSKIPRASFARRFANRRASELELAVLAERVQLKDGAEKILTSVRWRRYFAAMFTDTPLIIATQTVGPLLKAGDLFHGETLLTSDDDRLVGQKKFSPRGWDVLAKQSELPRSAIVAVEDNVDGAVGALLAEYGTVIVVPDPDRKAPTDKEIALLTPHLRNYPDNRQRLVFLRSLADIKFE